MRSKNYERVEGADGEEADGEESSASSTTDYASESHATRVARVFTKRQQYASLHNAECIIAGEDVGVHVRPGDKDVEVEMTKLGSNEGLPSAEMTIQILSLSGRKHPVTINKDATVGELKTKVGEVADVEQDLQRLIFMGVMMQDTQPLHHYKIQDGVVVHLFERRKLPIAVASSSVDSMHSSTGERATAISPSEVVTHVDIEGVFAQPHIQNLRRTIKLWSIFILLLHTMQLFVLLLGASDGEGDDGNQSSVEHSQTQLLEHMPHAGMEILNIVRIAVIFTGIAVGFKGLQGAERMDLRTLWTFSRGILVLAAVYILWLSLTSVLQYMAIEKMRREGIEDNDFIGTNEQFFFSVAINFLLIGSVFFYCVLKSFQLHDAVQTASRNYADQTPQRNVNAST